MLTNVLDGCIIINVVRNTTTAQKDRVGKMNNQKIIENNMKAMRIFKNALQKEHYCMSREGNADTREAREIEIKIYKIEGEIDLAHTELIEYGFDECDFDDEMVQLTQECLSKVLELL